MKRLLPLLVLCFILLSTTIALAFRGDHKFPAIVRCRHAYEDSFAHVKLVRFEGPDGITVYRCKQD